MNQYDQNGNKIERNYESMYNVLVERLLFVLDNKDKDVVIRKSDSEIEGYILEEVCKLIEETKAK